MSVEKDIVVTLAWVTRPERPKGAKDKVKRPKGPPTRSRGPEGPLDFWSIYNCEQLVDWPIAGWLVGQKCTPAMMEMVMKRLI